MAVKFENDSGFPWQTDVGLEHSCIEDNFAPTSCSYDTSDFKSTFSAEQNVCAYTFSYGDLGQGDLPKDANVVPFPMEPYLQPVNTDAMLCGDCYTVDEIMDIDEPWAQDFYPVPTPHQSFSNMLQEQDDDDIEFDDASMPGPSSIASPIPGPQLTNEPQLTDLDFQDITRLTDLDYSLEPKQTLYPATTLVVESHSHPESSAPAHPCGVDIKEKLRSKITLSSQPTVSRLPGEDDEDCDDDDEGFLNESAHACEEEEECFSDADIFDRSSSRSRQKKCRKPRKVVPFTEEEKRISRNYAHLFEGYKQKFRKNLTVSNYLLHLLKRGNTEHLLRWINEDELKFEILDSKVVALLYHVQRNNSSRTYDTFARCIRSAREKNQMFEKSWCHSKKKYQFTRKAVQAYVERVYCG